MCGICGKWHEAGVQQETLAQMVQAIHHRGPDADGYYVNGAVGLGSARLSIIDLEGGDQPITNEDETVWLVFNGEIYNHPRLRRELMARGHTFRTRSDTEVIVHLYEEQGPDCVKALRGMFALALWDEKEQRLLLARDPLGQKPLYYSRTSAGAFVFASEIKALLCAQEIQPGLNVRAMHNYISLRCVPGSETLFSGVHKVPAGHLLLLSEGEVRLHSYWNLQYAPKIQASEAEIVAQLRALLEETVRCHMLSDVPLGAFLSGGIDSSLVTALMSRLSTERIKTFSVGVKAQDFNELPYARMVAERYNTEHHELIVEPDLISSLPHMIWHMEEPVDPFAFGVYSVARLAGEHVKVVLGGDGGDELFAGYDRYLGNQIVDLYCLLPGPLRRQVIEPLIRRLPDNFSYNNRVQKLRWLVAMSQTEAGERYAASATFLRFGHAHKKALYSEPLWQELGGHDSAQHLLHYYNADNAREPLDKMLYTDVNTRLADHLLKVGDRMTMAHSLEGRSPYVDQQLAQFVATIPAKLKLKGRRLKHIQREVARDLLPAALVERPKQGFSFPLAYWFRNELRPLLADTFENSLLVEAGYFRGHAMQDLLQEHVAGKVDHNYRLWLLLNLELWYRSFIAGESQISVRTR